MIVRELITLLGFRTELAGLASYGSALQTITNRVNAVSGQTGAIVAVAIASIGALGAGAISAVAKAGDTTTAALNRLQTATGSIGEAQAAYEGLYAVAMRTGVSVADGARTFQRFAFAARDLGASSEDTIKVVQAIQQAALISGATTQESVSASIQLGQALSSGVLQGDELRSLTENMPILAREMAKHLGIGYDQFRKMAKEGKFTSSVVFPALLKSAAEMDRLFEQMTPTMALGWSRLGVVVQRILSDIDKALGISQGAARWLKDVAKTLESWRSSGGLQTLLGYLGSLNDMARLFGSAVLVAFGPAVFRAIMMVNGALLLTVARFALLTGAFVLATLAIEDFWVWLQGGRSVIGTKIGTFDEFKDKLIGVLEFIRDRAIEIFVLIGAKMVEFFDNVQAQALGAADVIKQAFNDMFNNWTTVGVLAAGALASAIWGVALAARAAAGGAAAGIGAGAAGAAAGAAGGAGATGALGGAGGVLAGVLARMYPLGIAATGIANLPRAMGPMLNRDPVDQVQQGANWNDRRRDGGFYSGPAEDPGGPDAPRRSWRDLIPRVYQNDWLQNPPVTPQSMTPANQQNVTATQTNTVTNDIRITAPGSDGASVAAATRSALTGAAGFASESADAFARQLGLAIPAAEAPTQ